MTKSDFFAGRRIGVIGTASPLPVSVDLDSYVQTLTKKGADVVLGRTAHLRNGYLAGSDKERARDVMKFFRDKSIDALVSLRGGYGSARMLSLLDYDVIRSNAKPFIGFSDNTALHAALGGHAGIISFHGPHAIGFATRGTTGSFARKMASAVLASTNDTVSVKHEIPARLGKFTVLRRGRASGVLRGGNLAVLTSLLGTPYFPDLRGAVLFLEEVGETPFRIDRMLTHLLLSGELNELQGIVLGSFTNCVSSRKRVSRGLRYPTVDEVLRERLHPLKVPILSGIPAGHGKWNMTLPLGVEVELDATGGDLRFPTICCSSLVLPL